MSVEATRGDLGEEDMSPPTVTDVERDEQGQVKNVIVEKGKVFKKKLEVPADRIQSIEQAKTGDQPPGKVTIETDKGEVAALSAAGEEALAPANESDLLRKVEEEIPTREDPNKPAAPQKTNFLLHVLGPGFLAGIKVRLLLVRCRAMPAREAFHLCAGNNCRRGQHPLLRLYRKPGMLCADR